ncbi:MAG: hypothetical protein ACI4B3_09175 [Prevotella sp.]
MKALKLLAIFLIIVGGLFLAFNWGSLFDGASNDDDFVNEDLIDISEKCDEIRKLWSSQTGWSDELYKTQREDIDQSKSMGMFSREGYNTVNNCLRETSTNKACDGYMSDLHAPSFSATDLQESYQGVIAIKAYEKLNEEPRIQKIEQIHKLYTSISNFIKSSHVISPKFDTNTADWVSFSSAQNGILQKAKGYKENTLFKELENIPGFKSGLNEESLKKQTNPQRKGFYQNLSSQIIDYFNSVEPTPDKVNLLNQIYKNFTYQESDYGVDELATLKVNYGKSE